MVVQSGRLELAPVGGRASLVARQDAEPRGEQLEA